MFSSTVNCRITVRRITKTLVQLNKNYNGTETWIKKDYHVSKNIDYSLRTIFSCGQQKVVKRFNVQLINTGQMDLFREGLYKKMREYMCLTTRTFDFS